VIRSVRDRSEAEGLITALVAREPSLHYIMVPVLVDGQTWYRVIVGPAASVKDTEVLRTGLSRVPGVGDPGGWFVRKTQLAFQVRRFDALSEARREVTRLAAAGIPAYVLEREAGSGSFVVYAGAFAIPREANLLRRLLDEKGIDAELTDRVGRRPA
jgi:cell division protein FtsN